MDETHDLREIIKKKDKFIDEIQKELLITKAERDLFLEELNKFRGDNNVPISQQD